MKAGQQEQQDAGRQAPAGATVVSFEQLEQAGVSPLPLARQRVRKYEELEGADGRSVFFRPHRYSAEDLTPLQGAVSVTLGGTRREFGVLDISQSGVAVSWPAEVPVRQKQRASVQVRFDGHEVFRGDVVVGAVRQRGNETVVAFSFGDFLLDVDEILQLRNVRDWTSSNQSPLVRDRAWAVGGGELFQARVAELRLLLEDGEEQLRALESRLPWHVIQGQGNPALDALVRSLRGGIVAEVIRVSEAIDEAVRALPDGHANAAARAWSHRHVHEYLMQAPCCHRARHKPFGYPGDYEVMNFIYTRNFEGPTLFARAVGLAFTNSVAARAVRHRKDLVKRHLAAMLSRRAGAERPVRVLSIAAGPAQELVELFDEADELPAPLEIVLFEQDKNALAHAWRRLKASVEGRHSGQVKLTFLHDSIKRLLRDKQLFSEFGRFDLIYSCGLYDYLAERTAVVLTRHLVRSAASGGQVLIANMVDHPTRWLMEHHLDWPLIYRTREELLDVGRQAAPGAELRILEEESRANPFFELTLP
jgi:hypothetical protein